VFLRAYFEGELGKEGKRQGGREAGRFYKTKGK